MPKNQQLTPSAGGTSRPGGGETGERIGKQVLATLGTPEHLYRVDVWPLWGECYRVNVLVSAGMAAARIVHSFFVNADAAGEIVTATPRITRHYGKAVERTDHAEVP